MRMDSLSLETINQRVSARAKATPMNTRRSSGDAQKQNPRHRRAAVTSCVSCPRPRLHLQPLHHTRYIRRSKGPVLYTAKDGPRSSLENFSHDPPALDTTVLARREKIQRLVELHTYHDLCTINTLKITTWKHFRFPHWYHLDLITTRH